METISKNPNTLQKIDFFPIHIHHYLHDEVLNYVPHIVVKDIAVEATGRPQAGRSVVWKVFIKPGLRFLCPMRWNRVLLNTYSLPAVTWSIQAFIIVFSTVCRSNDSSITALWSWPSKFVQWFLTELNYSICSCLICILIGQLPDKIFDLSQRPWYS